MGNKSRKAKAGVKWAQVRDVGQAALLKREEFARQLRRLHRPAEEPKALRPEQVERLRQQLAIRRGLAGTVLVPHDAGTVEREPSAKRRAARVAAIEADYAARRQAEEARKARREELSRVA